MIDVQSVLIPKSQYTQKQANAYIKKHKFNLTYKGKGVDVTDNYYRYRQRDPNKFERFYIIKSKSNVKFVIGIKK